MAGKKKISRKDETPAQKFERIAKRVLARDRRAIARREKRLREMAATGSQSSPGPGA